MSVKPFVNMFHNSNILFITMSIFTLCFFKTESILTLSFMISPHLVAFNSYESVYFSKLCVFQPLKMGFISIKCNSEEPYKMSKSLAVILLFLFLLLSYVRHLLLLPATRLVGNLILI